MTTYPGNYAVPGTMWPGAIWPGDSITASTAVTVFLGTETYIYLQYLDVVTGHTLVASPGGSYQIQVASGNPGVMLPPGDGRWQTSQQMMTIFAAADSPHADPQAVTAEDNPPAEPAEPDPIFEAIAKRLQRMGEQAHELEAVRLKPPQRKNRQVPPPVIGGGTDSGY
jgi:hypothetical protein